MSGPAGKGGILPAALGGLVLLLVLLLFLGWRIADAPRESGSGEGPGEFIPPPPEAGGGGPREDRAWEERSAQWRRMLAESSAALRAAKDAGDTQSSGAVRPAAEEKPAAAKRLGGGEGKPAEDFVEVDILGGALTPGEPVQIVWCSPDGTVWKRVLDRSFAADEVDGKVVRVTLSAEEERKIRAARLSGKVFAVPR